MWRILRCEHSLLDVAGHVPLLHPLLRVPHLHLVLHHPEKAQAKTTRQKGMRKRNKNNETKGNEKVHAKADTKAPAVIACNK